MNDSTPSSEAKHCNQEMLSPPSQQPQDQEERMPTIKVEDADGCENLLSMAAPSRLAVSAANNDGDDQKGPSEVSRDVPAEGAAAGAAQRACVDFLVRGGILYLPCGREAVTHAGRYRFAHDVYSKYNVMVDRTIGSRGREMSGKKIKLRYLPEGTALYRATSVSFCGPDDPRQRQWRVVRALHNHKTIGSAEPWFLAALALSLGLAVRAVLGVRSRERCATVRFVPAVSADPVLAARFSRHGWFGGEEATYTLKEREGGAAEPAGESQNDSLSDRTLSDEETEKCVRMAVGPPQAAAAAAAPGPNPSAPSHPRPVQEGVQTFHIVHAGGRRMAHVCSPARTLRDVLGSLKCKAFVACDEAPLDAPTSTLAGCMVTIRTYSDDEDMDVRDAPATLSTCVIVIDNIATFRAVCVPGMRLIDLLRQRYVECDLLAGINGTPLDTTIEMVHLAGLNVQVTTRARPFQPEASVMDTLEAAIRQLVFLRIPGHPIVTVSVSAATIGEQLTALGFGDAWVSVRGASLDHATGLTLLAGSTVDVLPRGRGGSSSAKYDLANDPRTAAAPAAAAESAEAAAARQKEEDDYAAEFRHRQKVADEQRAKRTKEDQEHKEELGGGDDPNPEPADQRPGRKLRMLAKRLKKKDTRAQRDHAKASQRIVLGRIADNVLHPPAQLKGPGPGKDKPEKAVDPHLTMPEEGPYQRLEFPSTLQISGMTGRTIHPADIRLVEVMAAEVAPTDRPVVGKLAGPSPAELLEDAVGAPLTTEVIEIPATIEDEMVAWWLAGNKAQVDGDNSPNLRLASNYLHHSLLGRLDLSAHDAVEIMRHVPMRSLERAVAIERERSSYANRHNRTWVARGLWWAALAVVMIVLWTTVLRTEAYDTQLAPWRDLRSVYVNETLGALLALVRLAVALINPRVAAGIPVEVDLTVTVPWPTVDYATVASWARVTGPWAVVAPIVSWYHGWCIVQPAAATYWDLLYTPDRSKEWFNASFLMGLLPWYGPSLVHLGCMLAMLGIMNFDQLVRRRSGEFVVRAALEELARTCIRLIAGDNCPEALLYVSAAAVIEASMAGETWRRAATRVSSHILLTLVPPPVSLVLHAAHNALRHEDVALDVIHSATRFAKRFRVYHSSNIRPEAVEMREGAKVTAPKQIRQDPLRTTECVASLGITAAGYRPVVYAANANNELSALNARVVAAPPCPPVKSTLKDAVKFAKHYTPDLLGAQVAIKPDSLEEYLRNSNASPQVKKLIEKQAEEDERQGVSWNSRLSAAELHARTTRTGFPKVENNIYRSPYGRKSKAARLIQGGAPGYIRWVGPWFSALQRHLKRILGSHGPVLFTSGKTAAEVADYISDVPEGWQILEDDIGKFDMSIDVEWCKYEVWLATYFGAPPIVIDLMRANIQTHGCTMSGYKYVVPGTRKSGDPFTSLFNSIINAWTKLYAFSVLWQATFHEVVERLKMVVQGDDNLLRHAGPPVDGLAQIMAELGFESECTYRRSLLDAEFCSMRMVRVNGVWTFTPKAGRFLSKFGSFVNPPPKVSAESLMRGVALSSYAACSAVRPLRKLLDRVLVLTDSHAPHFLKTGEWVMKGKTQPDAEDAFHDFCIQYSWDHGAQQRFEKFLQNAQLGDIINSPEFTHLCDVDTGGPKTTFCDPPAQPQAPTRCIRKARSSAWHHAATLAIVLMLSLCCVADSSNLLFKGANTLTPKAEEACPNGAGWPIVLATPRATATLTSIADHIHLRQRKIFGQGGEHSQYPPYRPVAGSQRPSREDVREGSQHTMSKSFKPNPTKNHSAASAKTAIRTTHQAARGKSSRAPGPKTALKVNGHGERRIPRTAARIRGRGDYDLGGALGGLAGSMFGMPELGSMLGSTAQKILGRGDYDLDPKAARWQAHQLHVGHLYRHGRHHPDESVQEPMPAEDIMRHHTAARDGKLSMSGAKFGNGMERPRVRARELIGSVVGSKDFTTMAYRIQPGALGTNVIMPWGSNIAKCFQQYKLNGMMFEYESRSSEYTTQTSLGTVYMSTQYAANASQLLSEETVAQNDFTTSEKPSRSFTHWIECADADNPIDIRYISASNSVVVTDDLRLNDVGLFQVSVVGCPDSAVGQELGKIWCTYDIEFLKKKMPAVSGGTTYMAVTTAASSTFAGMFADPSQVKLNPGNSLPVEYDPQYGTSGGFKLPVGYSGKFLLVISSGGVTGGGATGWQIDVSDSGAVTPLDLWCINNTGTNLKYSSEHGVLGNDDDGGPLGGTTALLSFHFDGSPDVYFTLAGTMGSVTSIRGATLLISALDPDIMPYTTEAEVDPEIIRAYLRKVEASTKGLPFARPSSGTITAPAREPSAPAPSRREPVVESLPDSPASAPLTLSSSLLHALTRAQLR